MASLGERIRKLRKEKGLTLQALAGAELSKGMLSLIENNKANPSMESLAYIAERLGVDRNELLEEVQLLLGAEAVELHGVLTNIQVGEDLALLPFFQIGNGIAGGLAPLCGLTQRGGDVLGGHVSTVPYGLHNLALSDCQMHNYSPFAFYLL